MAQSFVGFNLWGLRSGTGGSTFRELPCFLSAQVPLTTFLRGPKVEIPFPATSVFLDLPSQSLTWNLKMAPWKRRFLLETIIFRFSSFEIKKYFLKKVFFFVRQSAKGLTRCFLTCFDDINGAIVDVLVHAVWQVCALNFCSYMKLLGRNIASSKALLKMILLSPKVFYVQMSDM